MTHPGGPSPDARDRALVSIARRLLLPDSPGERPDAAALEVLGKQLGVAGFVVYALRPVAGVDAAMRCFFPGYGILEDPVTGSAAGQLGALIQLLQPAELPRRLVFTQGDEMGRPGRIDVEVRADAASVRGWIGGNAVTILRGELEL